MAKNALEAEIRSRLEVFATELAGTIRQAALESVEGALGGADAAPARRPRGRPRGSTTRRKPGRKPAVVRERSPSVSAESLAPRVLAHVKGNPGQGVTEIASALGARSDAVKPVLAALLAAKEIRKTGQRRGTKYHLRGSAGSGGPRKAARKASKIKRKATRKQAAKKVARKTRRPSKAVIAAPAAKPLPLKTIPAQRAPRVAKTPQAAPERARPGVSTPSSGAEAPAPKLIPAKEPRSPQLPPKGKRSSGKPVTADETTIRPLAEVAPSKG